MARDLWPRTAIAVLRGLPLNAISRLAGRIAHLRLPAALQQLQIRLFGALFRVDFDEVRDPIATFSCFQDFFVRRLRDGARPIEAAPEAFVSPCDGAWGSAGAIRDGTILQVKGQPYSLERLLRSAEDAARFEGGCFATLYLAPRDYHRFHAPCAVRVTAARYLPGTLWPVNDLGLRGVDGLFAQNERLCAFMDVQAEGPRKGAVCVIAIGAAMVGSVRVEFDDLGTNRGGVESVFRDYAEGGVAPPTFAKGEELGRFEFGSTLVLLAERGVLELDVRPPGTTVKLGTRIGTLSVAS